MAFDLFFDVSLSVNDQKEWWYCFDRVSCMRMEKRGSEASSNIRFLYVINSCALCSAACIHSFPHVGIVLNERQFLGSEERDVVAGAERGVASAEPEGAVPPGVPEDPEGGRGG